MALRVPFFHERTSDPIVWKSVGFEKEDFSKKIEGKSSDPELLRMYQISSVNPVLIRIAERSFFAQPLGKDAIYNFILEVLRPEDGQVTPRIETLQIDSEGFPINTEEPKTLRRGASFLNQPPKVSTTQYWKATLLPLLKPLAIKVMTKKPKDVTSYLTELVEKVLEERRIAKRRRAKRRSTRAYTISKQNSTSSIMSLQSFQSESDVLANLSESSDEEKPEDGLEAYKFRFKLQNSDRVQSVSVSLNTKLQKMMIKVVHTHDEAVFQQEWLFDIGGHEDGHRKLMLLISRSLGFKWHVFPTFKLTLHLTQKIQRWDSSDFLQSFLDSPKKISDMIKENPIVCVIDDLEGPDSAKTKLRLTPTVNDFNFIDGLHDDSDDDSDDENASKVASKVK